MLKKILNIYAWITIVIGILCAIYDIMILHYMKERAN